jgi:DNA (cytosine-5)-methyltransferase 1
MRALTVGSLFSGIGGIDLGLERAGMRVVWQSEIAAPACRILGKHWPGVPNLGDMTAVDFAQVERPDVIAGGFPCQDVSNAGNQGGLDGDRSGLWSEFARAIGALRPGYVFVENVAALLVRGLDRVLGDLAALGYDAEWDCIPAATVGAPHLRDRIWLVAYPHRERRGELHAQPGLFRGPIRAVPWDAGRVGRHATGRDHAGRFLWAAEPPVVRVADGIPTRLGELRGLGNAVVPQIPELIGGWIIEHARATGYLQEAA